MWNALPTLLLGRIQQSLPAGCCTGTSSRCINVPHNKFVNMFCCFCSHATASAWWSIRAVVIQIT